MAKIRKMHTNRIMVLIDGTWRLANAVPNSFDSATGDGQAELNGMIVNVQGSKWFNLQEGMSDEEITKMAVQQNIDQLFQVANQKAAHRKMQERFAERLRQAEQLAANPQAQPQPQPQPQPVVLQDVDATEDFEDFELFDDYDACDCEDCQRARNEV